MTAEKLVAGKLYPNVLRTKWYVWTGEHRPPKKGEFYLSGAVIEAHRSYGDMTYPYHIAREVTICPHCRTILD